MGKDMGLNRYFVWRGKSEEISIDNDFTFYCS